ncbi:MAG: DUF6265 family protein [Pseudomonadota bacterium]
MPRTKHLSLAVVMLANVLVAPLAHAADAPPIASLAWLAGCWNSENAEPGSGEHWMPLAGNALLGMSRTVRGGNTVAYEFMRIANAPDGKLTFFAQPSGKPAASFAVHTLNPNQVVFENLEHPFPQRIIYRLESPDRLHASIEGTRNGANRSIAYPMVRVSCDAPLQAPARP